ncbi:MAG: hypothetical protein K6C13_06435 [Oscillospiraceae bacterium]|nr:hypothetical protein [Oscillospiraceae bacterium]
MDYNTQRKAVSAIDSFGRRHKLLLPLCLAAKLFTIIFCAIVRFFDMTLSDDKGRFLGIESGKKPRSAGIPEDTGEKKHIQLRHRPLIWRALSFTLALAFMFMIVPHGMEIQSFAAGITITDINGDSILDTGEYNIGTTGCDLEASDFAGAGITGIGEGAFANKGNIYTADLSNITKIGDNAFYGAYSLTRVKLNPAITADDIGDNAFVGLAPDSVLIYQGTDPDVLNKLKAVTDNKKTTVINNNPPAVSDVSAITDYVTARGKTLIAFTPVSGAVDYAVYCRKNAGSGYERIASYDKYSFSDGRLGISVDDGKLGSNGNQVFLAVRVIDGQGNYSKHFTETPNAVVLTNSYNPQITLSSDITGNKAVVTWSRITITGTRSSALKDAYEADYYVVFVKHDGSSDYEYVKTITKGDSMNSAGKYEFSTTILGSTDSVIVHAVFDPMELDQNALVNKVFYDKPESTGMPIFTQRWLDFAASSPISLSVSKVTGIDVTSGDASILVKWQNYKTFSNYEVRVYDAGADTSISAPIMKKDNASGVYSVEFSEAECSGKISLGHKYDVYVVPYDSTVLESAAGKNGKSITYVRTPEIDPEKIELTPGNRTVKVEWEQPEGCGITNAKNFRYKVALKGSDGQRIQATSGNSNELSATSYTFNNVKNGVEYQAYITPILICDDDDVKSQEPTRLEGNEEKSVETAVPRLESFDIISVDFNSSTDTIKVTWSPDKNATGYKIYRAVTEKDQSPNSYEYVDQVPANTTSYDDIRLENNKQYWYKIEAIADNDPGNISTKPRYEYVNVTPDVTNISATPSDGMITVTWDAVDGATEYWLYVDDQEGKGNPYKRLTGTSYVHYMPNGERHVYSVRAIREFRDSGKVEGKISNPPAVATSGDLFPPPSNFTASTDDGRVNLSWNKVDTAQGYYIYEKDPLTGAYVKVADVTNGTSTVLTGLKNGDIKTYAAKAYKTVQNREVLSDTYSVEQTVVVGKTLNSPADVNAVGGDGKVTITWSKVDDAYGYIVYRQNDLDGTFTPIGRVTGLQYVDEAVTAGKTYTYMIRAYKNVNGSIVPNDEYSLPASATPYASQYDGSGLYPPVDVVALGEVEKIEVDWSKAVGASGYTVYRYNPAVEDFEPIARVSGTTYTDYNVSPGVRYRYKIRSYKEIPGGATVNDDEFSMEASAVPQYDSNNQSNGVPLTAPIDFNVTASDGSADLSWSKVKDAFGYQVFIINGAGNPVLLTEVTKTAAVHSGLTNGSTYTYAVRAYAYNSDGSVSYGPYSVYRSVTIGSYIAPPLDLAAAAGDKSVTLAWTATKGADGYVVYCLTAGDSSFKPVGIVSKPGFVHSDLVNGQEYSYMVAAFRNVGNSRDYSDYSLSVSATPFGDEKKTKTGYKMFIVGTTPHGLSHTEQIAAFSDPDAFNTDVDVRFSESPEATEAVRKVLDHYADGIDSFDIFPLDITLYVAGTYTKIEPVSGHYVTITMPMPDDFTKYGDDVQLIHITADGQMEILPMTRSGTGSSTLVQFKCGEFSPFAFVHYYTPEDLHSGSGTAAGGNVATGSSSGGIVCMFTSTGFRLRRRNKIYKIIKKQHLA